MRRSLLTRLIFYQPLSSSYFKAACYRRQIFQFSFCAPRVFFVASKHLMARAPAGYRLFLRFEMGVLSQYCCQNNIFQFFFIEDILFTVASYGLGRSCTSNLKQVLQHLIKKNLRLICLDQFCSWHFSSKSIPGYNANIGKLFFEAVFKNKFHKLIMM